MGELSPGSTVETNAPAQEKNEVLCSVYPEQGVLVPAATAVGALSE